MEKIFKDVAILAQRSLLYEVLLTPKPGLVDRNNSGAHEDMNIYTFMDSIIVLKDYFELCTLIGFSHVDDEYTKIFDKIRPLGVKAEIQMLDATNGINTHKGAIFIFGILCSAIGSLIKESKNLSLESITMRSGQIAKNILLDFDKDFSNVGDKTYGENQFLKYGSYGVRGEAHDGFPSIIEAHKVLIISLNDGHSLEISMGETLIKLIDIVFDSNVVGREGLEGLSFMKEKIREAGALGGYKTPDGLCKLKELDKIFIKNNISPGGCADLCAATVFVYWVIQYCDNL